MCSGRCWDVILMAEHLPVCQCNEEDTGSRWASVWSTTHWSWGWCHNVPDRKAECVYFPFYYWVALRPAAKLIYLLSFSFQVIGACGEISKVSISQDILYDGDSLLLSRSDLIPRCCFSPEAQVIHTHPRVKQLLFTII